MHTLSGFFLLTYCCAIFHFPFSLQCAGQLLSPSKFEQLGGRGTTRKWRRSLTVVPTQQGEDPAMTLGEWMKKFQADQQAALAAKSSDTDPAAEGGGRYSSQEQDDDAPRPRRRKPPPIDPDTVWELDSHRRKKARKARTPSSAPASSGGALQGSSLWPSSIPEFQQQQQQQQVGLAAPAGPPASSALPPPLPWPTSQQRPPVQPPSMLPPPDPRRQPHIPPQQQQHHHQQQQHPQGSATQEEAPHWQQRAASMLPPVPSQVLRMIPGLPAISQPPWAAQVPAPVSLSPQAQQQQHHQQQRRLQQPQQPPQQEQQAAAAGYMPNPMYQMPLTGPGVAPPGGAAAVALQGGQEQLPSSRTRAGGPPGVTAAAAAGATGLPGHSRGTGSLDELPDDLGNIHDLFGPGLSEAELSEVLRELAPGSTPLAGGTPGSQQGRHLFHVSKAHEPEGLLQMEEDTLAAGPSRQQRVRSVAAVGVGGRDQGRPPGLPEARSGRVGGSAAAPPPLTTPWSPTLPSSSSSKDAPGSGGSGEGSASHPGVRSMVPGAPLLMAPDDLMAHAPPALQLRAGPIGQVRAVG